MDILKKIIKLVFWHLLSLSRNNALVLIKHAIYKWIQFDADPISGELKYGLGYCIG